MRSLNTQDIVGVHSRNISINRIRINGNTSSINLGAGEQILSGTSLPNSPPRERLNIQQQKLHDSYNNSKQKYHNVNTSKSLLINDENDSFNKEIKKINLTITQFSNKVSNNININGGYLALINNNNSMNMSSIFKQNCEQNNIDSTEIQKKSLPTANECAPRMKSDSSYNIKQDVKKEVDIKLSEKFSVADNNLNDQNDTSYPSLMKQFQDQQRKQSSKNEIQQENEKSLLLSQIKFPVQQGVINLFDMRKGDEQFFNKSKIQQSRVNNQQSNSSNNINEQRSSIDLNLTTSEKDIKQYCTNQQSVYYANINTTKTKNIIDDNKNNINDIRRSHFHQKNNLSDSKININENKNNLSLQPKQLDQMQIKGIPAKKFIHSHNMFNTDRTSQSTQKQNIDSTHSNIFDDEVYVNHSEGFYGDESPLSPKPVEKPMFEIKALGERKLSSKDLNSNKKQFQQRRIQPSISQQCGDKKNKLENTKKECKKTQLLQIQPAKEQRIIIVCESSNQTREWVNRFLSMRNIFEYESFTLPGGPGCFSLDNSEERNCWQSSFKQFIVNMCKIYQIQEIQIFQNNNSVYSNIFSAESATGRGQTQILQENLRQAYQFVKSFTQMPVKGFTINAKGIIEKSI